MYKFILQKNYGIYVKDLYLVVLHPNNHNYIKIKCIDLQLEVYRIAKARLIHLKTASINTITDTMIDIDEYTQKFEHENEKDEFKKLYNENLNEFVERNYNDSSELTDFDKKFIIAKTSVKKTYKKEFERRKCLVFLTDPPEVRSKVHSKPEIKKVTCPATKMNGEICGVNVKPNKCFCGRHAKFEEDVLTEALNNLKV